MENRHDLGPPLSPSPAAFAGAALYAVWSATGPRRALDDRDM